MNRKFKRALGALGLNKARSEGDIRQNYFQKCAEAGELQYKIKEFSSALATLNTEIKALNQEYTKKLEVEQAAKAASAPKVADAAAK